MATKRIAVLGGPRCGKTTLIQHLYVEMKIAGLNARICSRVFNRIFKR